MIRFEYKVLKPFVIFKSLKGEKKVAHTDEERQSGTKFGLSTKYVDYESVGENIEQDIFTEELCTLKYLKIDREVRMLKKSY